MKSFAGKVLLLLFLTGLMMTSVMPQGQYHISGKVTDAETREPLAFVNIIISGTRGGVSTDIDGKFTLRSGQPIHAIHRSEVPHRNAGS